MNRLTSEDFIAGTKGFDLKIGIAKKKAFNLLGQYEETGLTPAEVAEFAQAKADGRLMVLPCKVGDIVWFVKTPLSLAKTPMKGIVKGIKHLNSDGTVIFDVFMVTSEIWRTFDSYNIGKTVFLTELQAQSELKRLEL